VPGHQRCDPALVSQVDGSEAPALLGLGAMEGRQRLTREGRPGKPCSSGAQLPAPGLSLLLATEIGIAKIDPDARLGITVTAARLHDDCFGKTLEQQIAPAE
jgi:hypothetical protein